MDTHVIIILLRLNTTRSNSDIFYILSFIGAILDPLFIISVSFTESSSIWKIMTLEWSHSLIYPATSSAFINTSWFIRKIYWDAVCRQFGDANFWSSIKSNLKLKRAYRECHFTEYEACMRIISPNCNSPSYQATVKVAPWVTPKARNRDNEHFPQYRSIGDSDYW